MPDERGSERADHLGAEPAVRQQTEPESKQPNFAQLEPGQQDAEHEPERPAEHEAFAQEHRPQEHQELAKRRLHRAALQEQLRQLQERRLRQHDPPESLAFFTLSVRRRFYPYEIGIRRLRCTKYILYRYAKRTRKKTL